MKNWTTKLGLGLVASAMLAIAACGGSSSASGFSCSAKGKCQNDVTPDQQSIDACNQSLIDPSCGAKFGAYESCIVSAATCTDAGTTVVDASRCASQLADYRGCLAAPPDAGGGG